MIMKKIHGLIIVIILLGLWGCDKTDDADYMFTQDRFIKYKYAKGGESYNLYTYSFVYEEPDLMEKTLSFPIEFRGHSLTENLYYSVDVDEENSLLPSSCYRLDDRQVFRIGVGNVDTLRITMLRNDVLLDTSFVVRLKLVQNANFKILDADSAYVDIVVGNKMVQPEWWNYDVSSAYLGTYSKEKYEEFHKETGIWDFGSLDPSSKRHYALLFKRALEREPRYEADNKTLMTVTITG